MRIFYDRVYGRIHKLPVVILNILCLKCSLRWKWMFKDVLSLDSWKHSCFHFHIPTKCHNHKVFLMYSPHSSLVWFASFEHLIVGIKCFQYTRRHCFESTSKSPESYAPIVLCSDPYQNDRKFSISVFNHSYNCFLFYTFWSKYRFDDCTWLVSAE